MILSKRLNVMRTSTALEETSMFASKERSAEASAPFLFSVFDALQTHQNDTATAFPAVLSLSRYRIPL